MVNFERFLRGDLVYEFDSEISFLFLIEKMFSLHKNRRPTQSKEVWMSSLDKWNSVFIYNEVRPSRERGIYGTEKLSSFGRELRPKSCLFKFLNKDDILKPCCDIIKECFYLDGSVVFKSDKFEKNINMSEFRFDDGIFVHNISYFNFKKL